MVSESKGRGVRSSFAVEQLVGWPHSESGVSSVKGLIIPASCGHVRKMLIKPRHRAGYPTGAQ